MEKYYNSVDELDELILALKNNPLRSKMPFCENCQDDIKEAVKKALEFKEVG